MTMLMVLYCLSVDCYVRNTTMFDDIRYTLKEEDKKKEKNR